MLFFCHPLPASPELEICEKILSRTIAPSHKLLFTLCWELAENFSSLLRLRVADAYLSPSLGIPDPLIWIPRHSRPCDIREIAPSLAVELALRRYRPDSQDWLFPSRCRPRQALSLRAAARALARSAKRAGIEGGCSPRQLKRLAIAHHYRSGKSLEEISRLSGLQPNSVQNHLRRIEVEERDSSSI